MTITRKLFITFLGLGLTLSMSFAATAQTPLSFDKGFNPSTIGPGGTSTLQFDIVNNLSTPEDSLAFTDVLPAGMTIASPASASTDCTNGVLSAPDGGGTISLSGGQVGVGGSCSVTVNVIGSATATNVSGDLTSGSGNSGIATATLTVDTARPGFSKAFAPSSISLGATSTLTFTIDNTANSADVVSLLFDDNLPAGMVVAFPANASSDCGTPLTVPSLTADPGTSTISVVANGTAGFPAVGAGASCTVSVDVTTDTGGAFVNTSGELLSGPPFGSQVSSGVATATLDVPVGFLTKSFTDDPVAPGDSVTLEFTIQNPSRTEAATAIAFDDSLPAGLTFGSLSSDDCGGILDTATPSLLSYSGGSLPAEGSCTLSVTLDVPAGATPGSYTNTTTAVTATIGGVDVTGNTATDVLVVEPSPILTKEFLSAVVGAGDTIDLRFTITNSSTSSGATDVAFIDDLTAFLPFPVTVSAPTPDPPCGVGSLLSLIFLGTERQGLSLTDGSLAAGGSCTFDVTLTLPSGLAPGIYVNTTGPVSATVDGQTLFGNPASDSFGVVVAPNLSKAFTDDPAQPNGTVTLQYTIGLDEFLDIPDFDVPTAAATNIAFTDDLALALPGLVAIGLVPPVAACGGEITGTSTLIFSGGSVAEGETCSFSVSLTVPAAASSGAYPSTTSSIVADVSGVAATGSPASDDLRIAGLELAKEFIDDPVAPGGTAALEFTITNISASEDATDISFTDNVTQLLINEATGDPLAAEFGSLPGLDPCGAGSSVSLPISSFLVFQNGTLTAGSSCTFVVTVQVPVDAEANTYVNVTSALSSSVGPFDPATDELIVASDFLALAKEFTDDPVAPGGTVNLRFTIDNLQPSNPVDDLAFSDDLEAVLTGLVATSLPVSGCGGTAESTDGGMTLDFSGGSLAGDASCTFDVAVSVPAGATLGTYTNTTSEISGSFGGVPVTGDPASDDLDVDVVGVTFSKSFDSEPLSGGQCSVSGEACLVDSDCPGFAADGETCEPATVGLTFNIQNQSTTQSVELLSFTDDLDAVLSGLTALGLPSSGDCGGNSRVEGTSVISLTDGSLLPSGSCTFTVQLQIPATAPAGSHLNTTSDLLQDGDPVADPATATLVLIAPDADGDGVLDNVDFCLDTVIPESVPTGGSLRKNRYALNPATPGPGDFFTFSYGGGNGPTLTTEDTGGCSCEQIIAELGLGKPHTKWGCTKSNMLIWIDLINGGGSAPATFDGRGTGTPQTAPVAPRTGAGVAVEVTGSGTVTSSRAEIDGRSYLGVLCGGGSSCRADFVDGATVVLYARPEGAGTEFVEWGGDCSGTAPVAVVTAGRETLCKATFESPKQ